MNTAVPNQFNPLNAPIYLTDGSDYLKISSPDCVENVDAFEHTISTMGKMEAQQLYEAYCYGFAETILGYLECSEEDYERERKGVLEYEHRKNKAA